MMILMLMVLLVFLLYQSIMTDCNDWWCDTGVHQRPGDLEVNVCKTKALTNMRASGIDNYNNDDDDDVNSAVCLYQYWWCQFDYKDDDDDDDWDNHLSLSLFCFGT